MTILVTGGTGFIGSNFAHFWLDGSDEARICQRQSIQGARSDRRIAGLSQFVATVDAVK